MAGFGLVVASASAPKEAKVVGGENALQVASRSSWSVGLRNFPVGLVYVLAKRVGLLDDDTHFWMDVWNSARKPENRCI